MVAESCATLNIRAIPNAGRRLAATSHQQLTDTKDCQGALCAALLTHTPTIQSEDTDNNNNERAG